MILNEVEILKRLVHPEPEKRLVITPLVNPEQQFGPTSVDVRLGTEFQVVQRANLTHLDLIKDPEKLAYESMHHTKFIRASATKPFILHPGEFALASTLEYIKVPLDIAARLEGRSTWGRLGLQIHATAGFVDPGFCGALTFELSNVSLLPIQLYPGVRIAQLCLFQTTKTNLSYTDKKYTKYSGKTGTAASSFFKDPEYEAIRKMVRNLD